MNLKYPVSLLLMVISFISFGQRIEPTSDWSKFFEDGKVIMYSRYERCQIPSEGLDAEYFLLKAENKTDAVLHVTWYNDTYFENGCTNCDHERPDRKRTVVLKPREVIEAKCGVGTNNGMRIYSKRLSTKGHPELQMLQVTDIKSFERN